jgi:hypothetical protein
MKWSDRTAQGFNPGWGEEKRALKVAPDVWAWLADQLYQFQTTSLRACEALRSRPRPRFLAGGVLEYWSIGVLRLLRIAPRIRGAGGAFRAHILAP